MGMQQDDKAIVAQLEQVIGRKLGKRAKYDEDGQLIKLDLSHLGLTLLPPELGSLSHLQVLSLHINQLTHVPIELGLLSNLQVLYLGVNQLTHVPIELAHLPHLQKLYLFNNQLTQVSIELGHFSNLQVLNLGDNQLTHVPVELGLLSHLQELFLNNNQLTHVPVELAHLSHLHTLDLGTNQLTQVLVELAHLSHLQKLYLHTNQLTQVPVELGQLSNLRELYLYNNQLTQVPVEFGYLSNLRMLDLRNNQLTQIPIELAHLSNLQEIYLENNPILTPPPEIVTQGTQAILTFLRELQLQSVRRYETKLILVGEGGTGKSSLLLSLRGEQFNTTLNTTHGIEVGTLSLPHPSQPQQTLLLNTWDFGGQHVYHATHQFFLTRRSLYLVVWNARLGVEQGRLHYWLDTIQALAPDSPILLVATHTDERTPDLNYQLYKDAYPQIVGAINVSNKEGTEVETLKAAIATHAASLPLVGQPWPTSWVEAEKALLARKEHHISAERYRRICAVRRIQARFAQGTLGSYLHDLGKILYFRDDYELSNLVVLKPNWVTKAISLVLEDKSVEKAHGILAHAELPRIWSVDETGTPYEPHLYAVFLRLMEKFDLSYQIGSDIPGQRATHSLVPQLLPHQPPAGLPGWPERPAQGHTHLQMVYRFDFVPAGIMSWFIVRTHRYTLDKHWREGVLLTYQQHDARVELNPMLREIRLVVWGVQPHNFFTILKDTLDLI
ncbi:MAG: leucine-rich repeat domain-containing protein, partial [Ktedonobacteraceae bacterium]|nr:leucine-rich repeat domain-containing protein [Ktedonobacteraceae bacterium]